MAMNKAERAELEAWRKRAALAWPTFERPEPVSAAEIDIATGGGSGVFRGWWVNIHRGGPSTSVSVGVGVVFGNLHARRPYTDEEISNRYRGARVSLSQGKGGPWYRDEQDALREAAWRIADKAAAELRAILDRIEAAK